MSFLDGRAPIAFAHRGYAPDGCENSMAAFDRAVQLGYRYLETDVRVTADGVAIAFHDATLDRVTDRRGRVSELSWQAVRDARIRGREPIPRLAEVLDAWRDLRINLDVKTDACVEPTLDAIQSANAIDRVCVGAFSAARVVAARRALGGGLCTSLSPGEVVALRIASIRRSSARLRSPTFRADRCAQLPVRIGRTRFVDAKIVNAAHDRGLPVHVWTVNTRADMQHLLDLGVDGIMTDRAELLRDVLTDRGAWPPRER